MDTSDDGDPVPRRRLVRRNAQRAQHSSSSSSDDSSADEENPPLRRCNRNRRPPERFGYNELGNPNVARLSALCNLLDVLSLKKPTEW